MSEQSEQQGEQAEQQDEPERVSPQLYEGQQDGLPPQGMPPAGDRTPLDPREDTAG